MVHENSPHHLRGDAEEMRSALPFNVLIDQPQVRFMHQGGALQRVPGALAVKISSSEATQFFVNERKQLLDRFGVALLPAKQQNCR